MSFQISPLFLSETPVIHPWFMVQFLCVYPTFPQRLLRFSFRCPLYKSTTVKIYCKQVEGWWFMTCAVSSNGFQETDSVVRTLCCGLKRQGFSFFGFLLCGIGQGNRRNPVTAEKAVTENGLTDDSTSNFLLLREGASCIM